MTAVARIPIQGENGKSATVVKTVTLCVGFNRPAGARSRGLYNPLFAPLEPKCKGVSMSRKEDHAAWRADNPDYQRDWRAANPEKVAQYRAENAARMRRWWAAWRIAHRDERLAAAEKRKAERLERQKTRPALKAAYRRRPEVKAQTAAWRRELYAKSPQYNLALRVSSAVRGSLKATQVGKRGKWSVILGYTTAELREHLERQFPKGMGWHNMPKWHVDHIVPLSSFSYSSPDDPEFKAAWALTNLRPMWGPANLAKGSRRTVLL